MHKNFLSHHSEALTLAAVGIATSIMLSCSSAPQRNDHKLIASGSEKGSRPFWTYDGDLDIERLRESMRDSPKEPKFAYVISRATVSKEELVPNCYEIFRLRASGELASRISEVVKSAKALGSSSSASEFSSEIESQTKTFLVGAEVVKRTWIKVEEEGESKVYCWAVIAVPKDRLKKLEDTVQAAVERDANADPDLKERVKKSMDKMIQTM